MNFPRQPFLGLSLAAGFGIISADFFPISVAQWWLWIIAFVFTAAVLFWRPNLAITYLVVGCGFSLLHNFRVGDTWGLQLAAELTQRPRPVTATGFVVSEPKIAPNEFATFLFQLKSIEFEGKSKPTNATLFVRWRGNPQFGDELKLFGIAEPIEGPRNPGEFDMRAYLARQDVRRGLFVRYPEDGVLIQSGAGNPVLRAAQKSRNWMQGVLCRGLEDSPRVQNFISGIALGLRHQTPEDIEEPFQQTGTLHLFAVAGLHVGIVARLLWIMARLARLSHRWAAAFVIPLLLFYAAVTGLHVSSVRAAVMTSILLGGFFFERKVFALNSLAAAAFFLLCWNTNEFFSTGFQLSFAVVGGIVLFADPLGAVLRRFGTTDAFLPKNLISRPRRLLQQAYEAICHGGSVSLAAWLGSLPLVLSYFHLVTPISLLANLVVVPIAFFILAIALLSLVTAPVMTSLSMIFNAANWSLATAVIALVQWFAQLPGSHFYVATPKWPAGIHTRIAVLDAGTGAAVHLRSVGKDWLFDCGSERDYERLLRPYLHSAGVNALEGMVLSHGDSLHIGGTEKLAADFSIARLIDNTTADRSATHRRIHELISDRHLTVSNSKAGERFKISEKVSAQILFPPAGFAGKIADDEALVIQVVIDNAAKILLTSDSGESTEKVLIQTGESLRSDILIKGQHRSGRSGSEPFLDLVQPKLIIATSRDFPQSERVSDEWTAFVRAKGIKLFRQDQTGAIELEFDRDEWRARAYLTGEVFRSTNR